MRTTILACLTLPLIAHVLAAAPEYKPLPLGSKAPDFSLPGVDGRTYSLKDFSDAKLLAVIFTCNHCPTAQAYEDRIKEIVTDYRPRGVAFIAINPNSPDAVRLDELGYTDLDDTLESMKIRAAHKQFNFPYVDDGPTQSTAKQYGPAVTPHVFIFDAGRKLRFQGRIDNSEREDLVTSHDTRVALDALLAGQQPSPAQTKVFGCATKWDYKTEGTLRWMEKVRQEKVIPGVGPQ